MHCFFRRALAILFLLATGLHPLATGASAPATSGSVLPPWSEGHLDIYHISTGRGNATYFIFPDGTTMLFDAGELNAAKAGKFAPMKLVDPRPNDTRSAGEWIARFIQAAAPRGAPPTLDYAAISHFHEDHYGHVHAQTPDSPSGAYKLAGLTRVGDIIPIRTMIDRGFPAYDVPTDLDAILGTSFRNYRDFTRYHARVHGMQVEGLRAGRDDQIVLRKDRAKFPHFSVRNVKCNGAIWTGRGSEVTEYIPRAQLAATRPFVENPLSLALKISYGAFDYYTGGDNTGLRGFGMPGWFDAETPIAQAVGPVDALVLNHHGNRDATNEAFLSALAPRLIVQQVWISDHPGGEVLHRMISESLYPGPRDIFSTSMREETKVAIGPWMTKAYRSFEGHVLIRISPGGSSYMVYVLDDRREGQIVVAQHGPLAAR